MRNLNIKLALLAIGVTCSMSAMAESMNKDQSMVDREKCASLSGMESEKCLLEAESKRQLNKNEIDSTGKPSVNNQSDSYGTGRDNSTTMQNCNGKTGSDRALCDQQLKGTRSNDINNSKSRMDKAKEDAIKDERNPVKSPSSTMDIEPLKQPENYPK